MTDGTAVQKQNCFQEAAGKGEGVCRGRYGIDMWIAENWKDYQVLGASGGEKLECWGPYKLIRPDPQVLWTEEKKDSGWKKPNAHYYRSDKGGGNWEFFDLPEEWTITYGLPERRDPLVFHLKPFSFKHTGLFPEQAANWDWSYRIIREAAETRKVRVLNLFAYTGGATIAAAAAGAEVTHVDASKGMVGWAKENAVSSGLASAPIRWLVDDCQKFVEREIRRGSRYDCIIMDPPSYGRGPGGEIWKIETSLFPFLRLTASLLSEKPLFFLINSYTTGLQAGVLSYMMELLLKQDRGGSIEAGELGLRCLSGKDRVLPEGASARWTALL